MTIINFDDIIGKKFKTITNNVFCLNHRTNCLIIRKTNSGKTNVVMNLIAKIVSMKRYISIQII